ncbi:MAG: EAL domain-containing protein [Burkholderiales bacterium]|nr:EAL domain-containing protein [Burkholderiales bacterium]
MRIRQLSRLMVGLTVCMLLVMGAVIVAMLDTQNRITASEQRRSRAHELAEELLQSSEDLTRMARSYVATGDPLFEQHYFEILDIRNGQRARPQHYAPTHWHLSGIGKAPAVPQEDAVALQTLLLREGVEDQEFALLLESQAQSDALVALERQAFAAMKGQFADANGALTVRRAPDSRLANNLLYSERYVDAKARIMAPIQKFADAIDARNDERIDALRSSLRAQVMLLLALVGVTLVGLFGFVRYNRRAVLVPLQRLGHHAKNLLQGRYSARITLRSGNELSDLGRHFNAIAQSLENDQLERELAEQLAEQAANELAARELLLQQILDTSSVSIFLVNMEGRITHANRRMAEMFHWSVEELTGKEYVELIAPVQRETGRGLMIKLLAGDIPLTDVERLYWRANGSEFWGHLSGRRLLGVRGEKLGLVGVMVDITDRKRSQERQQHHNRILKLLAENTPIASMLDTIVRDVEAMEPGMQCSVLLLDAEGKHLHHGAAPDQPPSYTQAIVSAQGKELGLFAIHYGTPRQPTPADIELIEDEARLAALVIEKLHADSRLQLAASVFSHAREGIMITDANGSIVEVNDTFTEITGYSREEALGHNPRKLLRSGHHTRDFYAARQRVLEERGYWSGEVWNLRKNGEVFAEMLTISVVRDVAGGATNYVALFTDITPLKEHQRQLEHIAHFDALTSLPNRVLLADRMQLALTQCQRRGLSVAVVYLDLDGFKAVNDTHGHGVGDELLVALAHRMKGALRNGDTLARIGGDEFVAVLVDLEAVADADPVLQRLLQAAADPVDVGDNRLQVSASVGVTVYPQDGSEVDLLLRHADQAMYVAKQAGKNRIHRFDVAQDTAAKTQRESVEHIAQGLQGQQFVLYYQPKVNMQTGAVIGAEALIRWQHPEQGLLAPGAFLPMIENHALSVALGEWVIASALEQMAQWQVQGLEMSVSVNIGARQLQQPDFAQRLVALLAQHPEIAPQRLELEILETSALEDLAQVFQSILACQAQGVRFALDDFGTGYSSLTHLRHLPAEVIKIDQSFVRDMLDDADDLAIVKGVIGLAAAFHRDVIAEGVETSAHGRMLQELGCESAQGYGIARPMPASDLPGWVRDWRVHPRWIG